MPSDNASVLVDCPYCNAMVGATIEHSAIYRIDGHPQLDLAKYTLARCPKCHRVVVAQEFGYDENADEELALAEYHWYELERVHPPVRAVSESVPEAIRRSYDEARRCLRCGTFTASALMCRRTLEALCKHYVPDTRTLASGLRDLHKRGIIDQRLFEWTEALRADGNLAAHDPEATFQRADAEDLADFTEAILDYVFVLHQRFQAFQARRAQRTAPKPPKAPEQQHAKEPSEDETN